MSRFNKLVFSMIAGIVIASAGMTARADTITIIGHETGQASTATIVCDFNSQTNTLTLTVTNTSPGTSTITGIGFDLPPTGNASASGLNGFTGMQAPSLTSTFTFSDAALGTVPGFNSAVLDFGFITGNSGNFNGGSPNDGLAPGESASFTVTGAAFTGFTAQQICNAVFVRFQGGAAGSDVGTPSQVPEPSSIVLLGSALVGFGGIARRRLKARG